MLPVTESEAKVVDKEQTFVIENYFLWTVFIRGAPVKDSTVLECIRTVAAMYGCKILQLYKYEGNCE